MLARINHPNDATVSVIAGVAIEQKGKVLLVQEKRPRAYEKWSFPAGHVEIGETIEEAATREAREEVGYIVELGCALNVFSRVDRSPSIPRF
jgi:8-oxo-dGTP diphosphatase